MEPSADPAPSGVGEVEVDILKGWVAEAESDVWGFWGVK